MKVSTKFCNLKNYELPIVISGSDTKASVPSASRREIKSQKDYYAGRSYQIPQICLVVVKI